jgi:hypothetical protein
MEPWFDVGEPPAGMGLPPNLTRYRAALVAREDAAERAAQETRRAELAERADVRRTAWAMQRMNVLALNDVPFDGDAVMAGDYRSIAVPFDRLGDEFFAAQDAEARRADFAAAKEAGLVHLLNVSPAEMAPASRSDGSPGPAPAHPIPQRIDVVDNTVAARARRALAHIGSIRRRPDLGAHAGRQGGPPPTRTPTRGTSR